MMNATSPASARRADLLAAGAATVTVVLWASAFVSIRSAGAGVSVILCKSPGFIGC
ncbi:hypothetical protein [Streptomyces mirabilis]|uniref:hypothetical protein n=1 Tax=Streptomyces mirabilis TaxID=68239 RepID=UPI003695FF8C